MPRFLLILCQLAVAFLPSPPVYFAGARSAQTPQGRAGALKSLPAKVKRYALVVGVDRYADTQISTLGGASNDARALATALVQYAGFPADQVVLLSSDQPEERHPTRGNILRRLSNLATVVPKDGLLLFAFAGHGMERGGQAFLLPSDAQVSDDVTLLEQTAVNVLQIRDWVKRTGVRQVLMILDACRNDPAGRANADNPLTETYTRGFNFDLRNREVEAFVTLYATAIGHRAYEFKEKRQGYFTWALVEGLKGAAANERGEVTLDGLVDYLQERVPKQVKLDLGAGKLQRPFAVVEGYKADELVLSVAAPTKEGRGLAAAGKVTEDLDTPAVDPSEAKAVDPSEVSAVDPSEVSAVKGRGRPAPAPPVSLEGTTWEGEGPNGPYTVEFLAGGRLRYKNAFIEQATGGTWKQVGAHVQLSVGGYANWNGKITGGEMKGEGSNAAGEKFTWAMTKKNN
ncbi:MAG TPA: caspase family protein [Pyrinomonadaceae bacterium]|nr:caspase family protein [Pyrinomonadaceae bacterium]